MQCPVKSILLPSGGSNGGIRSTQNDKFTNLRTICKSPFYLIAALLGGDCNSSVFLIKIVLLHTSNFLNQLPAPSSLHNIFATLPSTGLETRLERVRGRSDLNVVLGAQTWCAPSSTSYKMMKILFWDAFTNRLQWFLILCPCSVMNAFSVPSPSKYHNNHRGNLQICHHHQHLLQRQEECTKVRSSTDSIIHRVRYKSSGWCGPRK